MTPREAVSFDEHVRRGAEGVGHDADLADLMCALSVTCGRIGADVNRAGLIGILGLTGTTNVQGERVQKLDLHAHELLRESLGETGLVAVMGSEEADDPMAVPAGREGDWVVVFDPLDGSSNIDVGVSIGTIFGIYRRLSSGGPGTTRDLLQPGTALAAAGYVLYGSSTILVYTVGDGVSGFTLDPTEGRFLLSHPDIRTPERGKTLSINGGNRAYWHAPVRAFVEHLESEGDGGRPYTHRYVGSLVADFHRNLLRGGVFLYPADGRDPGKPHGKLRLLYEAAPLSFVSEQAGGASSTGTARVAEVRPTSLHQRIPLIIGSRDDVALAVSFHAGT